MKKLLVMIVPLLFLMGCNTGQPTEELIHTHKLEIATSTSEKEEYIKKLNAVEKELADLEKNSKDGTQIEMNEAMSEVFTRWDTVLNEIYGALEKQLPPDEMSKLKEEQRKWIKSRDEEAKKESLQYKGGSIEPLVYLSTLAQISKERCYELVEVYMK